MIVRSPLNNDKAPCTGAPKALERHSNHANQHESAAPGFYRALHLSELAQKIGSVAESRAHYVHRLAAMIYEEHERPAEDVTVGELLAAIDTLDMQFNRVYGNASGL